MMDAQTILKKVGFAIGMVPKQKSVDMKAAVTYPEKAEFVSDMVPRSNFAVSKDVLLMHKKVGFVEFMVPNLTTALIEDAATEPNMQVESVSDIVPGQRNRFPAVQNITSKRITLQTNRTIALSQVL